MPVSEVRMAISSVRGCRRPHPPQAVPLPLQGEGLNAAPRGDHPISGQVLIFSDAASEALPRSRRGEALRRAGWVGGVHPSAPLKARTQAFGGQRAFTRAARSAGLRFAVRSLSGVPDRENTLREGERVCRSPHPPRSGPPSPERQ